MYSKTIVNNVLKETRISDENKTIVRRVLIDGAKIPKVMEETGKSKQQIHQLVKRIKSTIHAIDNGYAHVLIEIPRGSVKQLKCLLKESLTEAKLIEVKDIEK